MLRASLAAPGSGQFCTEELPFRQSEQPDDKMNEVALITRKIEKIEAELAVLKRRKVAILQAEIERLNNDSGSASRAGGDGRKTRPRITVGWADDMKSGKLSGGGPRRGGRPTDRMTGLSDSDIVARLKTVIDGAGNGGISGAKAAEAANVPYQRSLALLKANFKSTGTGKGTRFHPKK